MGFGILKYTYAYKTSDGTRHEAVMDAESREVVFATLREKGIRAIKVVAADGSKANGEIRRSKRVLVLSALCLVLSAVVAMGVVVFALGTRHQALGTDAAAPRHQIYGDPAIVGAFERGDFDSVFTNKADRMLAWFAQPGKLMCPKGVDPRRLVADFAETYCNMSSGGEAIGIAAEDFREVRELKQIVNGLREELREYLANGNGTPRSYWRRLLQRTQQEMQIYERVRRELANEKSAAVWEEKNESLRRLGLRTIIGSKEDE